MLNNYNDEMYLGRSLKTIAAQVDSPYNAAGDARLFFCKGDGHLLYDVHGKEYVDLINGKGSIILGHNNLQVNAAIKKMIDLKQNVLTGPSDQILELTKTIINDIAVPDAKVAFFSTGTEACKAAAAAAHIITGKRIIISAGYHGWDPIWESETELLKPNKNGVINFYFVPELLNKILDNYKHEVALVIFSPDYVYLNSSTIMEIVSLCRKYNVLICCDDVKQGYRHRKGSSLELVTSEKADFYTFSKGLSNGHRISCLIGRADIIKGVQEFTFTSYYDLFSITAAIETLKQMSLLNGYRYIGETGKKIINSLNTLFKESGLPVMINGNASIFQFVLGTDELEREFYREAVNQGILLFEGDNQTLSCSFNETVKDDLLKRFEAVVEKLTGKFSHLKGMELNDERIFRTAWNMIDGASDIIAVDKRINLIKSIIKD